MKITLSKYAGFCDGVDRAYEIAEELAKNRKTPRPIFVLGSLAHNADVVKRIEEMGIKKISVENNLIKFLQSSKIKIGTLIITAHGIGPNIYDFARQKGINLVDATCPKVIKVQRLVRNFSKKNYQLIIIGERSHKEVRGIFEWANKEAFFVEKKEDLKKIKLDPSKKIAIISQTTQNKDFVKNVINSIRKKYPKAEAVDTLCATTHNRQNEIKKIAKNNDVLIVIGSPESANSRRLWEIGKKSNSKTYFLEKADFIQKKWFKDCEKVGITAGASTPSWAIKEVIGCIRKTCP
jgi:4-hydroxy-3-methylbut-2-enyl diphosphate reductase